ncbi:MAG: hypothetical protein PSV16_10895 [Flavobacterium sp.]|nr:hypothetical protein [Flavobacterium sp.]
MKKFRLHAAALVLFTAAAFTSCSSDDDNSNAPLSKTAFVTAVTGPTTGTVNTELSLNVAFTVDNACGTFDKVLETTAANTKTIEVKAKYAGTNCGTTPASKTTIYKFKATSAGTYNLKFKKSATEFVTQTIVVN